MAVGDLRSENLHHLRLLALQLRAVRLLLLPLHIVGLQAAASDAAAGQHHPLAEQLRRRPLVVGAHLVPHVLLQRRHQTLEVHVTKTLVAVGEHRQPNDDVGVAELGALRGHVLADEWDGGHAPALGHLRVQRERLGQLVVVQQTEGHTVDLGRGEGEQRVGRVNKASGNAGR